MLDASEPFIALVSVTFLRTINAAHVPTNPGKHGGRFMLPLDEGLTLYSAGRPQPIRFRYDTRGKVELDLESVRIVDLPACDLVLMRCPVPATLPPLESTIVDPDGLG